MSSSSRRRMRKLAKAQAQGQGKGGGIPVTGNMAERMMAISREERGKPPQPSPQLPIHYGGAPAASVTPAPSYNSNHDSLGFHGGYGGYQQHQDADTFRCDSSDITAPCPIAKVPSVHVPRQLFDQWIALAEDNKTEWLAYLIGVFKPDNNRYEVEKIYFPPQTATGGHVDVDEGFECHAGTIGAVHSHVQMQVFFSGEDLAHSNWPVEIVVNASGDVKAMVRHKLECGKYAKSDGKVWLIGDSASSTYAAALKRAFEKGDERRRAAAAAASADSYKPYQSYYQPLSQPSWPTWPSSPTSSSPPPYRFWCEPCARMVQASCQEHWDMAHGGVAQVFQRIAGEREPFQPSQPSQPASKEEVITQELLTDAQLDELAGDYCLSCEGHGWDLGKGAECDRCGGSGWEPRSAGAAADNKAVDSKPQPVIPVITDKGGIN